MGLLMVVAIGWAVLTGLGVIGAAAVCRSGHVEDVARGFVDSSDGRARDRVPAPRAAERDEVTHR